MKKISCRILSLLLSVLMVCLLAEPVCAGESVSAQSEMVQTSEAAESRSEQPEDNNAEAETREPVEVSSVGISRSELDLVVGETAKLSAAISPDNADNKAVSWVSANTAVAAVDGSGIVTAKASGNTVITVTSEDGGLAASCNVTVNAPAEKDASDKAGVSAENENASAAFDGSAASTAGNDVSNGKSSKKESKKGTDTADADEETVSKKAAKAGSGADDAEMYKTSLPDGEYNISADAFQWEGGTGKAKLTCTKVMVKSGSACGVFTASSASMSHVYYGGHTDTNDDDDKYYNPDQDRCGEKVVAIKDQSVTFPVVLNQKTEISGRTTAMSAPHWVHYAYTITLEEPASYTTKIRVTDSETGDELPDAVVTVKDQTSGTEISGNNGTYTLSGVTKYTITAFAEDYERQTRTDYTPASDETVELKLKHIDDGEEKNCSLKVLVNDAEGKAIAGAKVEVIRETDDQTISIKEKNGAFPVLAGKVYALRVSAPGYKTKEQKVNITEDSTETVVLEQELCKVHVRVIDADTQYNLSKAVVTVKDESNQTVSGTNGTYEVPYGTVLAITASNTGYQTKDGKASALQTVTASGEQTVSFEFIKQTYSVKVSVVDASTGSAISGASVTVKDGSTEKTVSAAGGAYAMQHGSVYTISASAANYASASVTHKATSSTTVTVRLESTKSSASGGTSGSGNSAAAQTEQVVDAGNYNVKYKTADNTMFNIVGVVLHVSKDGAYTADISLSGKGYDYVYPGTAEEALAAGQSKWSGAWTNKAGKYTYTIEVPALDQEFILASRSSRYFKEGKGNKGWLDGTEPDAVGDHVIAIYSTDTNGKKLPTHAGVRKQATNVGDSTGSADTVKSAKKSNKKSSKKSSKKSTGSTSKSSSSSGSSSGSGSTGAVNNQTGLKDGSYKPDSFSFSGGTGKLSISCEEIIIQGGKTYARIVFSSTYIQYVKAGGQKITDYTRGAGSTSFVIPVELNKNNTILALTTKMSQPHEVAYQIYIGLEAAKTAGTGSGSSSGGSGTGGSAAGAGQTEGKVDDQYDKLDEKAPEIMGLTFEKEIPVEHSDLFKLYQYAEGYKLMELDMHKRTALDEDLTGIKVETEEQDQKSADGAIDEAGDAKPEEVDLPDTDSAAAASDQQTGADESAGSSGQTYAELSDEEGGGDMTQTASEQKAALYHHAVYKYLLVPEGKEIPAGIDKQLFVVQMPLDKTAVTSSEALEALDQLGLTDQIAGVGIPEDEITVDSIKKAVQAKEGAEPEIPVIGTDDDLDYKTLLIKKMNILLVSGDLLPHPGSGDLEKYAGKTKEEFAKLTAEEKKEFADLAAEQTEKLITIGKRGVQLDMGVIADRSTDEETDLAKAEWLKVYGVLYGRETEADELYQKAGGTSAADLEKKNGTGAAAGNQENGTKDSSDTDTAADANVAENETAAAEGTATGIAQGVTDPVLRMLNLRNRLEGVPNKETTCEQRDGFLYVR